MTRIETARDLEAQEPDFCEIIVENEILGTREKYVSPFGLDETLSYNGRVSQATAWSSDYDTLYRPRCMDVFGRPPISACVTYRGNVITVRWYAVDDDPQAARQAMLAVLAGTYGEYQAGEEGGVL